MAAKDEKIIEVIIKGQQANATVNQIASAARVLNSEMKKLPVNGEEFRKKADQLKSMNSRLKAINDDVRNVKTSFMDAAASGAKFAIGFGGVTSIISGIKNVFGDAIQVNKEFEASIANLSAITGASGKDLEFYKAQAREMGLTTVGGAKGVVEAFKLIGSAKPELLQNKEALAEVTRQAILLSKAAGLDVPDAATRLTDALNQFGAPAKDAAKYVDILAAGAKAGAAEVPEVTDALLKFGVAAKSSNITIQESVGAIELLAEKGLKGAEAGTQLRNVFSKMSASSVLPKEAIKQLESAGVNIKILSDKTLPLQVRLKELSKIQGDAAAITQVFGLENKIAGEVLISNIPRLSELTEAVNEHGVAMEQAAKNTDTFEQAQLEAANAYDELLLQITEGDFSEILKGFVEAGTASLKHFSQYLREAGQNFKAVFGDMTFDELAVKREAEKRIKIMDEVNAKTLASAQESEAKRMEAMIQTNRNISALGKNLILQQTLNQKQVVQAQIENQKALLDKLKHLNDEEVKSTVETKEHKTKAEAAADKKILDARKKLLEDLAQLEIDFYNKGLDSDTLEIQKVHEKYQKLLKEAEGFGTEEVRIRNLYRQELEAVLLKQQIDDQKRAAEKLKKHQELQDKIYEATLSDNERVLVAEMNKWDALILEAEAAGLDATALRQAEADAINAIVVSQGQKEVDATRKTEDDKLKLKKEKAAQAVEIYNQSSDLIKDIIVQSFAQEKERSDRALEQNAKRMVIEKEKNDELLKAKLIDQREYDKRMLNAQKEHDKKEREIKKKAFDDEKKLKLILIGIELAAEIARIWSAAAGNPANAVTYGAAGSAQGAYLTAFAIARAGVQAAAVSSRKFKKGGFNQVSDSPQGFTSDATLFMNSASGAPFIAGEEGKEWIAPNWMIETPATANIINQLESIRQSKSFASGGPTSGSMAKAVESIGSSELINAINRLSLILDGGIAAYLDYDRFTRTLDKIDNAKSFSRIG